MRIPRLLVAALALTVAPLALAKPSAAGIAFPKGTQLQASYANNEAPKLKPEEKVAYLLIWSIHSLEKRCHDELDRYCTLDELVRGVPGKMSIPRAIRTTHTRSISRPTTRRRRSRASPASAASSTTRA